MKNINTEDELKEAISELIKAKYGERGGLIKVANELGWARSKITRLLAKRDDGAKNYNVSNLSIADTIKILDLFNHAIGIKNK